MHGCWKSEKGQVTIGKDPVTARLSYTVPLAAVNFGGWLVVPGAAALEGKFEILTSNCQSKQKSVPSCNMNTSALFQIIHTKRIKRV